MRRIVDGHRPAVRPHRHELVPQDVLELVAKREPRGACGVRDLVQGYASHRGRIAIRGPTRWATLALMTERPSGTVTLLFSDIEGSTRLLRDLGSERYGAVLDEYRGLVRECFAAAGGTEVDTRGTRSSVAFPRAADAARCGCRHPADAGIARLAGRPRATRADGNPQHGARSRRRGLRRDRRAPGRANLRRRAWRAGAPVERGRGAPARRGRAKRPDRPRTASAQGPRGT